MSRLPVIDATPYFDRRWGLVRTAKEARKRCRFRGAVRILVPPLRKGGSWREIRYDGRTYYQLVMSTWTPRKTRKKRAKRKATTRAKKKTRRASASFLWRGWPKQLGA